MYDVKLLSSLKYLIKINYYFDYEFSKLIDAAIPSKRANKS